MQFLTKTYKYLKSIDINGASSGGLPLEKLRQPRGELEATLSPHNELQARVGFAIRL